MFRQHRKDCSAGSSQLLSLERAERQQKWKVGRFGQLCTHLVRHRSFRKLWSQMGYCKWTLKFNLDRFKAMPR